MRLTSLIIGLLILMAFSAGFLGSRRAERQMRTEVARAEANRAKAMRAAKQTAPATQKAAEAPAPAPAGEPEPASVHEKADEKGVTGWRIVGDYRTTQEEARQAALILAQKTLGEHLEKQSPPVNYVPPMSYISSRLVKEQPIQTREFDKPVGRMYRAELEVRLTPEIRADLARHDRQFQSEQRMGWLFKMLGIAVVLLAAITGFLRLDDMTQGYYTGWLRLGAIGFVVGTILFLVFLA